MRSRSVSKGESLPVIEKMRLFAAYRSRSVSYPFGEASYKAASPLLRRKGIARYSPHPIEELQGAITSLFAA
ncbi:MAG: hypothetical protein PUP92_00395 [Rhizonema sp. PD38]|nr:hypothetical protein [Rhizonema sp. PD38]